MNLIGVLKLCNSSGVPFEEPRKVKMVRHADSRWDLEKVRRMGLFDDYQSRQGKDVFSNCKYVVAFMAERGTRSRFLGVYKVERLRKPAPWPEDWPYSGMGPVSYQYDMTELAGFEDLVDRLIVDWGKGTRSWFQWLKPRDVIEVLPRGYARDFPGYLDFILEFDELERIVGNPAANRVWHTMLRGVSGVYLITDTVDGRLYVGSAFGKGGILGRWTSHMKSKHGGNKELCALLAEHPERYRSFSFTILRTLPRTRTASEVIAVESLYKKKLGSRAFGLNSN